MRELIVGDEKVARVHERRGMGSGEIRRDDERRQPLAEARGHIERADRAVAEKMDALERAAQFGEQRVHLHAHARRPRFVAQPLGAAPAHQVGDRQPVAARDLLEEIFVSAAGALGEPCALEKLIRDALKRRHDADDRLAPARVEQDPSDVANRRRRGEGGAAELENFHASDCRSRGREVVRIGLVAS